jgi:hypothetical protein
MKRPPFEAPFINSSQGEPFEAQGKPFETQGRQRKHGKSGGPREHPTPAVPPSYLCVFTLSVSNAAVTTLADGNRSRKGPLCKILESSRQYVRSRVSATEAREIGKNLFAEIAACQAAQRHVHTA